MAEESPEPTLPRLPHPLPFADTRKRLRSMEPPPYQSASSDPAVFSSDDDPALDNYQANGRRKRRYVGSWFDQQPASSDSALGDETRPSYPPPRRNRAAPRPKKREFKRQLDSGVWMGNDGALTDTDDSVDLEPCAARLPLARPRDPVSLPLSPARPRYSAKEQAAHNMIRSCVDDGVEEVDLSGLHLDTIPDGLFEPIADIALIPNVTKDVAFEQRDPEIKVFLSNNFLRTVPLALFNVEHLTVLSLRANHLVRIPPSIAKLTNLETLNIAQNSLRFLPSELLSLLQKGGKLRSFQFQPNSFWTPASPPPNNPGAQEYETRTFPSRTSPTTLTAPWTGLTTQLQSRTPVQFIDSSHKTYSRFTLPPAPDLATPLPLSTRAPPLEIEPFTELAAPRELHREAGDASRSKLVNPRGAKSLFELAVRACAASGQAEWIAAELRGEEEYWPEYLAGAVERAADILGDGGVACSVCGRETVMPLVRWVEFRQVGRTEVVFGGDEDGGDGGGGEEVCRFTGLGGQSEGPVPFVRVGCSWSCVPVRVEDVPADAGSAES